MAHIVMACVQRGDARSQGVQLQPVRPGARRRFRTTRKRNAQRNTRRNAGVAHRCSSRQPPDKRNTQRSTQRNARNATHARHAGVLRGSCRTNATCNAARNATQRNTRNAQHAWHAGALRGSRRRWHQAQGACMCLCCVQDPSRLGQGWVKGWVEGQSKASQRLVFKG